MSDADTYNSLAAALENPIGVTHLKLSGSVKLEWSSFSSQIKKFTKLKKLELDLWDLTQLPQELLSLPQLQSLHFTAKLEQLPSWITNLSNLRHLNIDSYPLRSLPDNIGELSQLETLSVNANFITSLPKSLFSMKNLRELKLTLWKLPKLSAELECLTSLQTLDIHCPKLSSFPDVFAKLHQLKSVCLAAISDQIPSSLWSLSNLNQLCLWRINQPLPVSGFYNLCNLKSLKLWFINTDDEFPDAIAELKKLEELNIIGCTLKRIPEKFSNLTQLNKVYIQGAGLTDFPDAAVPVAPIQKLSLCSNALSSLPDELRLLEKLEELNVSKNRLTSLPAGMGDLKNLKKLTLFGNCLKTVPEEFSGLSKLELLDIADNKITDIPSACASLSSLRILHLNQNQIESFSVDMLPWENLKTLLLKNNPLTIGRGGLGRSLLQLKNYETELCRLSMALLLEDTTLIEHLGSIPLLVKALDVSNPAVRKQALLHLEKVLKNPFQKDQKLEGAIIVFLGSPWLFEIDKMRRFITSKGGFFYREFRSDANYIAFSQKPGEGATKALSAKMHIIHPSHLKSFMLGD